MLLDKFRQDLELHFPLRHDGYVMNARSAE